MVVKIIIKNWDGIIDNNIVICIIVVWNENIFKDCYLYNNMLIFEIFLKYNMILGSEGYGLN